jgi:caffeoyl-CoA O-methyltransferase
MVSLVSPEIDRYALEHTTTLPPYFEELPRITRERMGSDGMISGPVVGGLLQTLVWASGARRVLEIGTFTGFSALMMAEALPDDGSLLTCEQDPKAAELARDFFARSPHGHKIELRLGRALDTVRSLEGPYDFVFIDADKENNAAYYERALELLSPMGLIAIDNVLWGGQVLDPSSDTDRAIADFNRHVQSDPRVKNLLLPVRDGVMVVRRA